MTPEEKKEYKREWKRRARRDPIKGEIIREKARVQRRKDYSDPEKRARLKAAMRKWMYGLEADQFQSLWDAQHGRCAICKGALFVDKRKSFNIDHCHNTGRVRGLLCNKCNTGLGLLGDDPERLRDAIVYLEK